eukprot:1820329-Rhodomonas_salina.2
MAARDRSLRALSSPHSTSALRFPSSPKSAFHFGIALLLLSQGCISLRHCGRSQVSVAFHCREFQLAAVQVPRPPFSLVLLPILLFLLPFILAQPPFMLALLPFATASLTMKGIAGFETRASAEAEGGSADI